MASVTLSPTTATGSFWTNPTNITAQDSVYATTTIFTSPSFALVGTYPGASIPSGSVIDGIEVMIRRYASSNGANTNTYAVTLPKGTPKNGSPPWPNTPGNETFGGPTDLWGTTWTPADFNSSFNVQFKIAKSTGTTGAYVDYMSVTIYYTPGTKDISATATQAQTGTVNLGVQRPLAATATQVQTGTVALGVKRPISATATQAQTGTVALGVKRPISASASQDQTGTVALGHAKTISAAAAQGQTGTVTITVNNPISATATQDQTGTVNLTVTRPISASASQGQTGTVNITVATTWTISSSATQDQTGTATLGVKRPLATLGEQPQAGTVNLGVQRSISAAATQLFSGSVAITVFAPITYVHKLRLSLAEADILRASPQSPLLRAVGNDPFTRQHHASPLTRVQGNDPVLRVQQE